MSFPEKKIFSRTTDHGDKPEHRTRAHTFPQFHTDIHHHRGTGVAVASHKSRKH